MGADPAALADAPPGWDVKALRMVTAIEGSLVRLHRDDQGQVIAILNAMLMQLESGHPVPVALDHLAYALLALAQHRLGREPEGVHPARRREALTRYFFSSLSLTGRGYG